MAITAAQLEIRVGADTSAAERGLQSMGSRVQSAGRAMTSTGLAMTAGFTAPLLGIAAAALNSAADFEQSMNVLQQVTGASTGTMDEMTQAALRLGAETSFSAGEAADAMLELAKAGMETDEVLASIGGVMDLAAAGGIALADAANITANALNAFGLEASEADRVANMFAGAANNSSAEISDLADGMAQAGFAFANAGQPIENLVASLAILTDVGLTGSDAGTALKNAFMRLMNPTKEAQSVMKALNLEFYDANGQMKALPDIITMLNEAFTGMTDEQRDAALGTIFLSDGMKAMIPLLDAGAEGFNDMVTAVNAEGQASAVAGARMKGLRGAIEYLKGSIDSFLIGVARPFLDMIGEFIRQGADWLTALGDLPPAVTNAALAFGAVLAVAGPVALAIGGLISVFSTLNPIILAITVAVAGFAAAWSSDFMGIQTATMASIDTIRPYFMELLGWIDSALQGDWGPLRDGLSGWGEQIQLAVANFDWRDYITNLAWDTYVTLLSWGEYVSGLLWDGYLIALEWASYVPGLLWDGYLIALEWGEYVAALAWDGYLIVLEWAKFIPVQLDWSWFVALLEWASFIPLQLDWSWYVTLLEWSGYVFDLAWDTFVDALEWSVYVTKLNWDNYLSGFSWETTVPQTLDWSKYIVLLPWTDFVERLFWNRVITQFVWTEWIQPLDWGAIITKFEGWSNFIDPVLWATFIAALVWSVFIGDLTWSEFVQNFQEAGGWGLFVPDLTWREFVTEDLLWDQFIFALDYSEFIPDLTWPSSIFNFVWGTFVSKLSWPGTIFNFSWSNFIPDLSWPSSIFGFSWGDFIPDFSWPEFSAPELPDTGTGTGEDVLPPSTIGMAKAKPYYAAAGAGVTIGAVHIHNDMDVEVLAATIARRISQGGRR